MTPVPPLSAVPTPGTQAVGPSATPAPANPAAQILDASLLSFTAAFVDTCGFVGLFGIFTAHVTGNFVLMGAQLVQSRGEFLAKLLSFPVFVLAIAATLLLSNALSSRGIRRLGPMLWIEATLIAAASVVAYALGRPTGADSTSALAIGMIMVAAMGLQNGMMRLELPTMPPTTVMTGNVTGATIDIVTLWVLPSKGEAAATAVRQRLGKTWPSMLAFLVGAAGGAGGYAIVGFWCLLLPAASCAWLALRMSRNAP